MARFFCERCQNQSNFLPIYAAMKIAGVSRSTIYYWLEHDWVHRLQLPSGRRVICEASLTRSANAPSDLAPEAGSPKKLSRATQFAKNL